MLAGGGWWSRPAARIPPPPPRRGERLALVFETNGHRLLEACKWLGMCLLGAGAAFLKYRDLGSPLSYVILGSLVLALILKVVKPKAVSAGRDWLQVVPGQKGTSDWVRTTQLDALDCTGRPGRRYIEMRDRHGRSVSVSVRDLNANNLIHALVITAVRASRDRGAQVSDLAVSMLGLDQPSPEARVAHDEDGRPTTTFFAIYHAKDGPNRPFAVVRRTPGDPLPTDEVFGADLVWIDVGYALQFDASRFDGGYAEVSETRALQLIESIRERVTPQPMP